MESNEGEKFKMLLFPQFFGFGDFVMESFHSYIVFSGKTKYCNVLENSSSCSEAV